jgi:hypothetical protein
MAFLEREDACCLDVLGGVVKAPDLGLERKQFGVITLGKRWRGSGHHGCGPQGRRGQPGETEGGGKSSAGRLKR